MTLSGTNESEGLKEAKLPRRDWILLPLLGLLTISIMAGSTELVARRMFTESRTTAESCAAIDAPANGIRPIMNSVCMEKHTETPLIEYRFNSCGHRAGMECGPKRPGTYRIVMTGSSFAMGMRVQREQSFAALLPQKLSRQTGRSVELYNEGMAGWGGSPRNVTLRFGEVLAAQPDLVLWILTSWDVEHASLITPNEFSEMHGVTKHRLKEVLARESIWNPKPDLLNIVLHDVPYALMNYLGDSKTTLMVQHCIYKNQSLFVNSSLKQEDGGGRLGGEMNAAWLSHLKQFDSYAADIEKQAQTAGVPLVAVLVPDRAQAAMISMGEWPQGYDPYKLDDELRSIITRHGGIYIDILPDYRNIPNPEQGYLPVDGHPNANGHATISKLLAKELTNGAVPALRAAAQSQVALEQGR